MKGKILDFFEQSNEGIISGDDGKRYKFSGSEWKSVGHPKKYVVVDFETDGEQAIGIYSDTALAHGSNANDVPSYLGLL